MTDDRLDTDQLCYSARLLFPFARTLRKRSLLTAQELDLIEQIDPDERLPISAVHKLLASAIERSGDPDIGLKAAREITPGDYGAIEYLAGSASTWGSALSLVGRYMGLINGALRYSLHTEGEIGMVRLDSTILLPRASADFQSGAFHRSASHLWSPGPSPDIEAWFSHSQPVNIDQYALTFPGAVLRFDAPFNGFAFRRDLLDRPMRGADPKLHAVIRKHAEAMLHALPHTKNLTERVRDMLSNELTGGTPTLSFVAGMLNISESTVARYLAEEGTSFKVILEDLRRRLALTYIRRSSLPISEIALLLGFSQAAAFHRAFRRWTGATPLEYRRAPVLPHRD